MKNIIRKLGIADIYKDIVYDFNLNPTFCYELKAPDITYKDRDAQHQYLHTIENILNSIPQGITLQFYLTQNKEDKTTLENYNRRIYKDEILNEINNDTIKNFSNLSTYSRKIYCFISYNINYKKDPIYYCPIIFDQIIKKQSSNTIQQAIDSIENFINIISALVKKIGADLRRMSTKEIFCFCYKFLNPNRRIYIHPEYLEPIKDELEDDFYQNYGYLKNYTLRDQLLTSAAVNNPEYLYIDNKYCTSLNYDLLPIKADGTILQNLMYGLGFNCEISIAITAPYAQKELSSLSLKRRFILGSGGLLSFGTISEADQVNQFDQLNSALGELSKKEQKLFVFSCCALIKESNLKDCLNNACLAEQLLNSIHHGIAIRDDYNHLSNFFSFLPGQYLLNKRQHSLFTKPLTFFTPFLSSFQGTEKCQFICKTSNEEIIPLNLIENNLPASHGIIIAPTGKGKSFTMNFLLKNLFLYNQNDYFTIIDKGGSYQKICSIFKGNYIKVELKSQYAINPFLAKKYIYQNGKYDPDQLIFLKKLIILMVSDKNLSSFTAHQEYLIEKAIRGLYDIFFTNNCPCLGDFQTFLKTICTEDSEDQLFFKKVIKNLNLFTNPNSAYSILLNNPSQISFDNHFIVFDRTSLSDHPRLQSIYFFLINNYISLRMKEGLQKNRAQYVIFEEIADLLIDKNAASLLAEKYRTARKYGTIIFSISQMLEDFLQNNHTQAVKANSYIKLILQMDDSYNLLDKFGLNENEIISCRNLEIVPGKYSQVFVKFGNDSFIWQVEPSRLEYEICSTDARSFSRYSKYYGNSANIMFKKIVEYAQERHLQNA